METMRKLVTVREISNILPIENADNIEIAVIDGWSCIIKKDTFTVGDKALFFEIDSFIPASDKRFDFLGESKQKVYLDEKGWRIRTQKLRGALSQGLLLPLNTFPEITDLTKDDYSELLNVIKYDIEVANPTKRGSVKTGNPKGKLPSFLRKSDQPRLQNLMHYFSTYKEHEFEETLKLDGSNCSIYKNYIELPWWKKATNYSCNILQLPTLYSTVAFGVCSRNLEIKRTDNQEITFNSSGKISTYKQSDFWEIAYKYSIEDKLPAGYAIQGELIGPKIQSNHEKVKSLEFHIFDVWDINNQEYLLPSKRKTFVETHLKDVPHVPITADSIKVFSEFPDLDSFQERVTGQSINPKTISEGRTYKSTTIPGFSFKLISNKFLLKNEK